MKNQKSTNSIKQQISLNCQTDVNRSPYSIYLFNIQKIPHYLFPFCLATLKTSITGVSLYMMYLLLLKNFTIVILHQSIFISKRIKQKILFFLSSFHETKAITIHIHKKTKNNDQHKEIILFLMIGIGRHLMLILDRIVCYLMIVHFIGRKTKFTLFTIT